jgi:hypothetical protein
VATKRWGDIKTGLLTLIVAAEEKYGLYDNDKKLVYVIDTVYQIFPKSKLLKMIPLNVLKAVIEGLLTTMKVYTKSTTETAMKRANEVKSVLDNYSDKLINQDFFGDKNLVANDKIIELKKEVLKEWTNDKLNGVVKGFVQTDFTKKGTVAGVSGEIKF